MQPNIPEVSIIIPVLNEEDYIEDCIESVISSISDLSFEILIIDGGSLDGTLEILKDLQSRNSEIKVYDNPKKITPSALNIGIKNSRGKYIVRLDAHAFYHDNYVENSVKVLKEGPEEIANVGGPILTESKDKGLFATAISLCLSSIFGVGNSKFRTNIPESAIYVETVPFGCFKREIFEEIGLFNETEPKNEDLEFNKRILDSGRKILLHPSIKSTYFARTTFTALFSQQFDNGKIVTDKLRGNDSFHKLRHFVPLFFVSYLVSIFPFLYINSWLLLESEAVVIYLLPLISYIFLNSSFSLYIAIKNRLVLFFPLFISFLILHVSNGLGSIYGLFRNTTKG